MAVSGRVLELSTPQGLELHLDMSTMRRPVLILDVTQQGPELQLDFLLQRPVLHLDLATPKGPELHLDLVGRQELVLLLDMSTLQGRELHLNVLRLLVACTAAGLIYTTEAFIRICLHTGA